MARSNQSQYRRLTFAIISSVFIAMCVSLPAQAIVIRDDVDDAEYLLAAGSYEAVFDVFEKRGGVGTLISSEWAITAGHVGQDIPVGHRVEIAGAQYEVQRVILHPEWESSNR